jgi:ABC-2 type transport system permease protein
MIIRIGNLIVKEFIQFKRDWVLTTFILLAPALQLILMAQSVERGITEQPVVILDQDRSRLSRQLEVSLDNTEELRVRYHVQSMAEVRRLLDQGTARLAVIIPSGFSPGLGTGRSPQRIQIIADATNSLAASVTMSAAAGAVGRLAASLASGHGLVVPELIDFRTDVRFNPTMDFRDFSIPAQLGFLTYQVTLAVSLPLLAALTLLFIAAVVSWGLVISAISRTQQQAILFVFILAMMEITFSGFMVPVKNMPTLLQAIARLAPLQHYLVIIRGIMLKGAGLDELWPQVMALVALSLGTGMVALRIVARQLE